jgi:miniconductance mechanosensitive channel
MRELLGNVLDRLEWSFIHDKLLLMLFHLLIIAVLCLIVYLITKKILLVIVDKVAAKSKTHWDDKLVEAHLFRRLSHVIPVLIAHEAVPYVLADYPEYIQGVSNFTSAAIVVVILRIILAFVNGVQYIMEEYESLKDKPLKSYSQLIKIVLYIIVGILLFSILTGKKPWFFLSAMGAMSAILLLVFKDTIMGFVGSIQLAANDMVRIGDWITMKNYGADGDVIEINLSTIKVRNFDNTITTIPTYSLISDSFTNWRGMSESGGRRIKRSINIKASSVKFCTEKQLDQFKTIELLNDYVESQSNEISEYNTQHKIDTSNLANGRNLTNIGVFRKYLQLYLEHHMNINHDMTCMVRQLSPTEKGIPIEVYAFSQNKEWIVYEAIMADIFDHIFAVIGNFELEVFQSPTGSDFKSLTK